MKKVLLALSILTAHNALFAQIEKGNFLTGISGGYSQQLDTDKNHSFSIAPNIGYFMLNRLAAGSLVSFQGQVYTSAVEYKNTSLSIGPFLRYYVLDNNKFNVFMQPSFQFTGYNSKISGPEGSSYNEKRTSIAFAIAPVYFINEHVSLALLNNITKYYYESGNTRSYFNMQLGLQIHLRCKKKE